MRARVGSVLRGAPPFQISVTILIVTISLAIGEVTDHLQGVKPHMRVLEPFSQEIYGIDQELQLSARDDFVLECEAPLPIAWNFPRALDSEELFEPSVESNKGPLGWRSTLTLLNASAGNSGFYSCHVDNSTQSTVYVYFTDPNNPWVRSSLAPAVAIQYEEATLDCRPNNRSTKVRLLNNRNKEIPLGFNPESHWTLSWDPKHGFTISSVNMRDAGMYFCVADGFSERLMLVLHLLPQKTNLSPPEIHVTNAVPHAILGRSMILRCQLRLQGISFFDMTWKEPNSSRARAEGRLTITDPVSVPLDDGSGSSSYRLGTINLTVTDLKDTDAGTYICNVKDHYQEHSTPFDLVVKDGNVQYIQLPDDELLLHQEVNQGGNATWMLNIVTYPPSPSIAWFGNDGKQLTAATAAKFVMHSAPRGRGLEVTLTVLEAELRDRGAYMLRVNTGLDEKTLNLTLEVFASPVVLLEMQLDPLPLGREWLGRCRVQGWPLPSVTWAWRPCPALLRDCSPHGPYQAISDSKITRSARSEVEINSTVLLVLNSSGYLSCIANNSIDIANDTAALQVSDIPDLHTTLDVWGKGLVVEGEDIELWCGALRENHTVPPRWDDHREDAANQSLKLEPERMNITHVNTSLSLRTILRITRARENDSGYYKCYSGDADDPTYSVFHLLVKLPQKPFALEKTLNNTEWRVNQKDILRLPCNFNGLPKPNISWFKDGQPLSFPAHPQGVDQLRLENEGAQLVLNFVTEADQGEYRCRAENRYGAEERWAKIILKSSLKLNSGMVTMIVILALLLLAIFPLTFYLIKDRQKRRRMMISGLHHFVEGQPDILNVDLPADEQAELLPYDKKWEFPRERLKLGKQLGAGAFGVVLKAEAQGIVEGEESTTVAVKMVKRAADFSYHKALASELKIMVHLGRHINVVNLLGACTGKIDRFELLVIVEYCRFGNLHNYLLRHRDGFVDQIDPRTGTIDASIGAEYLQQGHDLLPGASGGRVKYASLSFTGSSDTTGGSDTGSETGMAGSGAPVGPVDYRAAAAAAAAGAAVADGPCVDSSGNETICMSPTGGEETGLTSSGSAQPHWRSNYRGDYRGRVRPICTRDLLCWGFQVARGMQYLAGRKVLHGDLAARNILLADGNIVKICDFGLAKSMYKSGNYKKKGDSPLPVKWMALESIRDAIFSTQSDVWSFGIVLWELFSLAQTPYPGMAADERLYSKLQEGYRMEKPPYATDDLYQVMRKCWEARPVRRPTFEELSETLGGYLEESVRNHYLDLNNAYIDMNEQWRRDGAIDYLGMLGTPDYTNMVSPQAEDPNYINSPASPSSPSSPVASDGYLMMRGATPASQTLPEPATPRSAEVFSPRPSSGAQVFTFTGPCAPSVTAPSLAPMPQEATVPAHTPLSAPAPSHGGVPMPSMSSPLPSLVEAVDNPGYSARFDMFKSSIDNYVNVPQQRLAAAARGVNGLQHDFAVSDPATSNECEEDCSTEQRFLPQPLHVVPGTFSSPLYVNAPVAELGSGQHVCA